MRWSGGMRIGTISLQRLKSFLLSESEAAHGNHRTVSTSGERTIAWGVAGAGCWGCRCGLCSDVLLYFSKNNLGGVGRPGGRNRYGTRIIS